MNSCCFVKFFAKSAESSVASHPLLVKKLTFSSPGIVSASFFA